MLAKYSHNQYDSSDEEDQFQCRYTDICAIKSIHNKISTKQAQQNIDDIEDDDFQLAPKLKQKNQQQKIPNKSTFTSNKIQPSEISRRPLTAAYTFKLKGTTNMKKKKIDPVSLFQQTSQVWKKDAFLTNRGNNKEGRKLNLQQKNKGVNKT